MLLPEDEEVQVRLTDDGPELVFVDVEGQERVVRPPMRRPEHVRAAA